MNTRFFCITIAAFAALFTPALKSAYATPAALEGTVMDANWHPINNATVRIQAKKGEKTPTIVRTDARGHYFGGNLDSGTYRVTLLVNGAVKASINNATARDGESRRLDFNLTGKYGARVTHLVYLPEEKGSHLNGHWVDVDKLGRPNNVSVDNIETLSRFATSDNTGAVPSKIKNIPGYDAMR
jgi:hypothetical protein